MGSDHSDFLVTHDRWCLYRPTVPDASLDVAEESVTAATMLSWRTDTKLHLDMHPWQYRDGGTAAESLRYLHPRDFSREVSFVESRQGPHVQAVLNLVENRSADGGTLVVPGFHKCFDKWLEGLGSCEDHYDAQAGSRWLHRGSGGATFKFHLHDPINERARRVPLRAGSLLVWDQRLVHGGSPNSSSHLRMAQFVKAWSKATASPERLMARAAAVESALEQHGSGEALSLEARRAFGLPL